MLRAAWWLFLRLLLSLRYRIRVPGTERLRGLRGPLLILPNHPAYNDPVLVLAALGPVLRPRLMFFEGSLPPLVRWAFVNLLGAVPVPELERASAEARVRTRQALDEAVAVLRRGENFVLWPAGHVWREGIERLRGARGAAQILQAVPEASVVLVRTRGLWGSRFSFAYGGKRPPLSGTLLRALLLWLTNLFFFLPRRKVDLTVEPVERARLPEPRREALNPWLEEWFNAPGPEAPTFVPYHFLFGPRTREFPPVAGLAGADLGQVTPKTKAAVAQLLSEQLGRPLTAEEQRPNTSLDRLGLDSLERMDLMLAVEQRFGFSGDQVPADVGQLWALAQGLAERAPPKPPPAAWFRPPSDAGPLVPLAETVAEAFVARALADPNDVAAADDLSGVLTYRRMLVGVLVLARRFAPLPGANVGLMLPASVACDVAFLALHLAGKLPVLLNWTTGPAHLAHAARLTDLRHVVTSRAFLDRVHVAIEGVEYVYLEDLRKGVGRVEQLRTLLTVRLFPGRVRRRVPRADPQRPAMVLFTSGSERAPKAVPLTHVNLMGEMRAGVAALGLTRGMALLAFLPAFHSFGIVVTSLLPILGGLRVVHHPDPTDGAGLARKAAAYRPTMLVGTPTFLNFILERARPGELASLRLVLVGAEKSPAALAERVGREQPELGVQVVDTLRPGDGRAATDYLYQAFIRVGVLGPLRNTFEMQALRA